MAPLAAALQTAIEKIEVCRSAAISIRKIPARCAPIQARSSIIVVVADVADLWALERAHAINARYHVLGGTLSPLDGIGPQDLSIDALISRAQRSAVKEVILALNATVDGQTTAHYITDLLHGERQGDAACSRRAGRRRARLSRRGHARRGDPSRTPF